MDDFGLEVEEPDFEEPESEEPESDEPDVDFAGDAGLDSEAEEEDPDSPEPLPAATLDAEPDRLSVR